MAVPITQRVTVSARPNPARLTSNFFDLMRAFAPKRLAVSSTRKQLIAVIKASRNRSRGKAASTSAKYRKRSVLVDPWCCRALTEATKRNSQSSVSESYQTKKMIWDFKKKTQMVTRAARKIWCKRGDAFKTRTINFKRPITTWLKATLLTRPICSSWSRTARV